MKLILKLAIIAFIGLLIVAIIELTGFVADEQFWNSIPDAEEIEYHREYERMH